MEGCIPPFCELLTVMDTKMVQVALTALQNILRIGEMDSGFTRNCNPYSAMIEECYGQYFFFFFELWRNLGLKLLIVRLKNRS